MQLGLSLETRQSLERGEPPAIPIETLGEVLGASRGMRCICRMPNQPIVAHAIIPLTFPDTCFEHLRFLDDLHGKEGSGA